MISILLIILASFITYSVGQTCTGLQQGKGCYFNGTYYSNGQTIPKICFGLTCVQHNATEFRWNYTGRDYNCSSCRARNDPHFRTFDNLRYDWHGLCNYTLSQYFECPSNCSYYPKYGVYSDFYLCNSATASCVGVSTYKVNANTVITINHLTFQVLVNGQPISVSTTPTLVCNLPQPNDVHPLIVWGDNVLNYCMFVQGLDFSIRACDISIHLYTTRDHLNLLDGLCGFYTGSIADEFLTRECDQLSIANANIPPFAKSWMTIQQKDDGECCPNKEDEIPYEITCIDEAGFRVNCAKAVDELKMKNGTERTNLIDDCVNDCCRAPPGACDRIWIPNTKKLTLGVLRFGD